MFNKSGFLLYLRSCKAKVFVYLSEINRRSSFIVTTSSTCYCNSGLVFLIIIAVLMTDSGMINILAEVVVSITENFYPLLSPFVGLLGAFITGSNTNSNVIFGKFQETVANQLGINAAIICAAQSIGASIGGAIGPTTTALAATAASISGKESLIYRKTLLLIIGSTFVLGLLSIIIILLWSKV